MGPAVRIGAGVVAVGAAVAFAIPRSLPDRREGPETEAAAAATVVPASAYVGAND